MSSLQELATETAHLLGVSLLLGGGLAMTLLRYVASREPGQSGSQFLDAAAGPIALFFWVGILLVAISGPLRLFQLTGSLVPDTSPWGLLVSIKVALFMPVIAKAAIVSYYLYRRPGGRSYPSLSGPTRWAFMLFDLLLVMILLPLGVLLHSLRG